MVDIRQSVHFANYLKRLGWNVERTGEINYFIRKFPIIGSVLKVQRPQEIRIDIISKLARKYRAFTIVVEPKTELDAKFLTSIGFKLSKNPYLPTKTLQIDLTQSKETILRNFKKDARGAVRKGSVFKIKEYSTPNEIKTFREAWKKSVNFKRYVPKASQLINLRKSFPHNYSAFLASHNISGKIIGGVIFTRSLHDYAYYWQAFISKEGRTSLSQYSLLYQGILWAKKMGCKVFDFEGIYDPRFPNKSWLGFTHFKKSFGGFEVEYPGCYIKNLLPFGL
jgi:lipid II:glycine glycyltransferase (peptidoglycan interpeptide bridge formation enzyme)